MRRVIAFILAMVFVLPVAVAPRPAAGLIEPFDPAFLITDEEFNDPGAMSCEQIQAFLNERKGVLKAYAIDGRPAAQIICENAARFNVNPRILLVMMQKEMGLLTDPQPTDGALNWAMGCGPGWPATRGFAVNVECGARTLRRNFDRPGLGQESIEGVTPVNRGTLALYRYTQHVEGNRDLWGIWNGYFPASAASGLPPEIYVDSRDVELAPQIKRDPACLNGWHVGTKARGNHHLSTPNVATEAESTNKAIWRPNLPREGGYRVFVFIPNRAAIQWACGPVAATLDTTNARYIIKHRDGATTYTVNQAPIHDGWVDLGSYYFAAGSDGYLELDDLTGEPSNSRWVTIDDARFVWLGP
jgi:hypothetical protein